jgi:hypothetical protein
MANSFTSQDLEELEMDDQETSGETLLSAEDKAALQIVGVFLVSPTAPSQDTLATPSKNVTIVEPVSSVRRSKRLVGSTPVPSAKRSFESICTPTNEQVAAKLVKSSDLPQEDDLMVSPKRMKLEDRDMNSSKRVKLDESVMVSHRNDSIMASPTADSAVASPNADKANEDPGMGWELDDTDSWLAKVVKRVGRSVFWA